MPRKRTDTLHAEFTAKLRDLSVPSRLVKYSAPSTHMAHASNGPANRHPNRRKSSVSAGAARSRSPRRWPYRRWSDQASPFLAATCFVTAGVIVITLVLQGLLLPSVVRWPGSPTTH